MPLDHVIKQSILITLWRARKVHLSYST